MQVGDTIQWDTVKGVVDGVVESVAGTRCLARLDNGKCVSVDATPKVVPAFVLGTFLPANCGDELAKLVNGANVRKETALFPAEIADMMKGIHLI